MVLRRKQNISYKEEWDTHLVVIQYSKYGIYIGKQEDTILLEKENQLDLFIFLGQNSVRMKVIWRWGHVYKTLLLIMPLALKKYTNKLEFLQTVPS